MPQIVQQLQQHVCRLEELYIYISPHIVSYFKSISLLHHIVAASGPPNVKQIEESSTTIGAVIQTAETALITANLTALSAETAAQYAQDAATASLRSSELATNLAGLAIDAGRAANDALAQLVAPTTNQRVSVSNAVRATTNAAAAATAAASSAISSAADAVTAAQAARTAAETSRNVYSSVAATLRADIITIGQIK